MDDTNSGNTLPGWDDDDDDIMPQYNLRLFVKGASPASLRAISNIKIICEQYLSGRYELEVVDVHQQPSVVQNEDITAVPVLIKILPLPKKKLIGDLSDTDKVLKGLGIL